MTLNNVTIIATIFFLFMLGVGIGLMIMGIRK